jgi:hypothetical protein
MKFIVTILMIICLNVSSYADEIKPVLNVFNKNIKLLSECKINLNRSTKEFPEYFCTTDGAMEYSSVSIRTYNYSDIVSLLNQFKREGSISKIYFTKNYEVFELSATSDKSRNLYTQICDPYLCITILGQYKNMTESIKNQIFLNL